MAKRTKESEYKAILQKLGIAFERCKVLAFTFNRDKGAEVFHFDLMLSDVSYIIFDTYERTANVVVLRNADNESRITEIAVKNGGVARTPNIR